MILGWEPLHHNTERHVDRMATRDDEHIQHLDLLIRYLSRGSSPVWDKLTELWVCGPDQDDSLIGIKSGIVATLIGSPPFTAYLGFSTNSATPNLINTNIDEETTNNRSFGGFVNDITPGAAIAGIMGSSAASDSILCYASGGTTYFIGVAGNSSDTPTLGVSAALSEGLTAVSRNVGTVILGHIGMSATKTSVFAPSGPSPLIVGSASASGGGSHQARFASWFTGSAMSQLELQDLWVALQNYHLALGAGAL